MREFALEAFFSRQQGDVRHQMTASESETTPLADLLRMADEFDLRRWEALKFGYTDPHGALWLRDAIAAHYRRIDAQQVLCFTGAQEAIFAAMQSLLEAGDHAVVVTPGYQSAETVPLSRCAVSGIALDPEQGWGLDIDQLAAAIQPNTKLVSINFPNNPTGKILERDRFDALVALCRRHGLWLFSDEVYRLIERDPAKRLPAVADVYERGISLGGLSKSFGLPGLRLGWLISRDADCMKALRRAKAYLSICNAAPCEVLASVALKASDVILSRNRRIAEQNLAHLGQFFDEHADLFEWRPPDGAVVAFPRYLGADGVDAFCDRLITHHGVLLMPARIFHSELTAVPAEHFRIGFGRRDFVPGLAALAAALRTTEPSFRMGQRGLGR
jgi:aspartate/methionine/tyrosine aminotransferase